MVRADMGMISTSCTDTCCPACFPPLKRLMVSRGSASRGRFPSCRQNADREEHHVDSAQARAKATETARIAFAPMRDFVAVPSSAIIVWSNSA